MWPRWLQWSLGSVISDRAVRGPAGTLLLCKKGRTGFWGSLEVSASTNQPLALCLNLFFLFFLSFHFPLISALFLCLPILPSFLFISKAEQFSQLSFSPHLFSHVLGSHVPSQRTNKAIVLNKDILYSNWELVPDVKIFFFSYLVHGKNKTRHHFKTFPSKTLS